MAYNEFKKASRGVMANFLTTLRNLEGTRERKAQEMWKLQVDNKSIRMEKT